MRRKNTPKGPIKVKSSRKLKPEEVQLWQKVKKTIEPQSDPKKDMEEFLAALGDVKNVAKQANPLGMHVPNPANLVPNPANKVRAYETPSYSPPTSKPNSQNKFNAPIDDPTVKKLAKGRLPIEARVDLHGMSQVQAYRTLSNFVEDSYRSSMRIVLVITGKGRISEGVLRNAVPNWLKENELSTYVSGYRTAHISHGGSGALYVRIRKNKY